MATAVREMPSLIVPRGVRPQLRMVYAVVGGVVALMTVGGIWLNGSRGFRGLAGWSGSVRGVPSLTASLISPSHAGLENRLTKPELPISGQLAS